jgi:hypothetical protein
MCQGFTSSLEYVCVLLVPYFIFIAATCSLEDLSLIGPLCRKTTVNWEVTAPQLAQSYLVLRQYNSNSDSALLEVSSVKRSPSTCSQWVVSPWLCVVGVPHYVAHFPRALIWPLHPIRPIMTLDLNTFLLWFKLPSGFISILYYLRW